MTCRRALVGALAVGALGLGLLVGPPALAADASAPVDESAYTDQLIVTATSPSVSDAALEVTTEAAAAGLGLDLSADVTRDMSRTTSVVRLDEALSISEAAELAAQVTESALVARAEPDLILQAVTSLPDDPYTSSQWGLWDGGRPDGGYSTRAPDAWPTSRGNGVVVAVVDTGITSHPDLNAHVLPGYDFISYWWVSNDGDGRDPDPSDPGDWDGYYSSSWHGTHVAGTIAAVTNNTLGVAGIAPDASILPVRVLGTGGGYTSDIADAVTWASGGSVSGVPANPTPAKVINMSLGGGGGCGYAMQTAIDGAISRGTTVVVAAGNSNQDAAGFTPANCNGVITVAAHTSSGTRASFSNYGSSVEISGPGVGIWSTLNSGATTPGSPTYASYSGTSMATPHVAGVVALLLGADPTLTPAQVTTTLQSTSQPFASGSGCSGLCGAGYVDARAAIASLSPGAPTGLAVTADYEELDIAWAAPASGIAPTYYDVQHSSDDSTWLSDDTRVGTSTSIPSLTPGTSYYVRVRAVAGAKSGSWVKSAAVAPLARTAPGPVGTVTTQPFDDTTLEATWPAPANTGGLPIQYYRVEYSSDDSTWISDDTTTSTSTRIDGLPTGLPERVRITAVNALGAGPTVASASLVASRTVTVPGAPTSLGVTAADAQLTVSWGAPSDNGGRAVTSYAVQYSTDDSTWTALAPVAGLTTTITGLANGTGYIVRVAAINSMGQGSWARTTGTPLAPPPPPPPPPAPPGGGGGGGAPPPPPPPRVTAPGVPTITDTGVDDRSLTLVWAPSDDTGGATVTSYMIELSSDAGAVAYTTTEPVLTVAGLTNGTSYRAHVASVNSAGPSDWSTWSEDLVPRGPATAPQGLTAVAGDSSLRLSWAPPADNGGSPVSSYVVEVSAQGTVQELIVDDTDAVLVGLMNNTRYTLRVAAETDFGAGAWSSAIAVTPKTSRVSGPTNVSAVRTTRRVNVTWSAPEVGTPSRYVISASIDRKPWRIVSTTTTLRAGFEVRTSTRTVQVRVAAIDSLGRGPWSPQISATR